ncbi:hypothetical protein DSO57_1036593 [Entomophthora muscae]|uniref:Uncharacterized protein n=1 Tax=Entomophthora muscae TaxID=34485 RepID=A0ACC2S1F4_9FUNG|nr:hypothetical protein DSO57_1036593 [Entomophthora muscae]
MRVTSSLTFAYTISCAVGYQIMNCLYEGERQVELTGKICKQFRGRMDGDGCYTYEEFCPYAGEKCYTKPGTTYTCTQI